MLLLLQIFTWSKFKNTNVDSIFPYCNDINAFLFIILKKVNCEIEMPTPHYSITLNEMEFLMIWSNRWVLTTVLNITVKRIRLFCKDLVTLPRLRVQQGYQTDVLVGLVGLITIEGERETSRQKRGLQVTAADEQRSNREL